VSKAKQRLEKNARAAYLQCKWRYRSELAIGEAVYKKAIKVDPDIAETLGEWLSLQRTIVDTLTPADLRRVLKASAPLLVKITTISTLEPDVDQLHVAHDETIEAFNKLIRAQSTLEGGRA
jgi:hypothetical protein